jgi:hypothetical protein
MKTITFFVLGLFSIHLCYAQDTCESSAVATPGINSVGTINGTFQNNGVWASPGSAGEWYRYTASIDGVVTITSDLPQNDGATNSNDTRLSVSIGTCNALIYLTRADDISNGNLLTSITFKVTTGLTYYLLWDDRWSNKPFDFELTESEVNCPDGSLPFADNFSDPNTLLSCWETIDNNYDGFGWFAKDYDINEDNLPDGNPTVASASKDIVAGALNPDNWLISPMIDLTPYSSGDVIELTWDARSLDPNLAQENYSVYAATSNAISTLVSSGISFSETLASNDPDMDGFGNFESRSLNLSALAGQTIYVAFRHHDVSNASVLNIDNIAINLTLNVNEFEKADFKYFYNDNNDNLTLESSKAEMSYVEIYCLLGKKIISKPLATNSENINLFGLNDGIYLVKVQINGAIKTIKFVKS